MNTGTTITHGREYTRLGHWFAAIVALIALLAAALPAMAQEYQKVGDKDITMIAANPFIAGAYGFIWVAVTAYVFYLARGMGKVNQEIEQLKRKIGS